MVSGCYRICLKPGKARHLRGSRAWRVNIRKTAAPPFCLSFLPVRSAQQLQHARLRLVGKRQRGDRDRLAGRQRLAVGRFLVGIGKCQVGRTGLQHVDQVLREVLADLHDRQVRTESRGLRPQRVRRAGYLSYRRLGRGAVQKVRAGDQRSKAKACRVEGHSLDGQSGLTGLVEGQLEVIAIYQVDAVERRVLRRGGDLCNDVIVLGDQVGTNGLRGRIGNRGGNGAESQRTGAGTGIANGTDGGRGRVVGRGDDELVGAVEAGGQVVGRQSSVQLVEGLAGAEGDGGRRSTAGGTDCQNVAALDDGAVDQVGRIAGEGNRRGNRRLGRITGGRLQHLVGDRFRGVDQLLQRCEAGIGGLQDLHAVADAIEQIVDVTGAVIEARSGKVIGRIVERGVDLLAGGETVLSGGEKLRGGLQRQQVLANRGRENNTGHRSNLPKFYARSLTKTPLN